MDKNGFLEIGSKPWASDRAYSEREKLFAGKNKPSFSKAVIKRFRQELGDLWSSGVQKPTCFPKQPHGESSFRFLLANEAKRSERSGHSFHVLLTYFAEADGGQLELMATCRMRWCQFYRTCFVRLIISGGIEKIRYLAGC